MDDKVIAALFGGGPVGGRKSRYIDLAKATKEPSGWPLTRRATGAEWKHTVKAMFVRRVPKTQPIERHKLLNIISDDVRAASDAGKLYLDVDASKVVNTLDVMNSLMNDKVLRHGLLEVEEQGVKRIATMVYRTEYTEQWEQLVPRTVQALLDIMPVTDILDMLVDALIDDER